MAAQRQLEPVRLTKLLRGELDWIVMKSLEKERSRRYDTASSLARDVERYLADESVEACPPSAVYRLRKFVRRNRGSLLVVGALAATPIVVIGAFLAIRAEASRNRAAREARATASVAAAVRVARERASEAWLLFDDPARMKQVTDAAIAELDRADESVAGEPLSEYTRIHLSCCAARRRRSSPVTPAFWSPGRTAAGNSPTTSTGKTCSAPEADFCSRAREAIAAFGLDPLAEPVEQAARKVADCRVRDPLLGFLLEWKFNAADARTKERLGQVVEAARRRSGRAYAHWQELLDRKDIAGLVAFATSPEGLELAGEPGGSP